MMFRKVNRWAAITLIAALIAVSFLACAIVMAETISTHNEEQAAYNAAIRIVIARGCTPEFRRTKPYTVDATPERVTIVTKEVAQDCAAPVVTWAHPVARKDGTPLAPSEIRGYQITSGGAVIMLPPVTEYHAAPGATIRTVDTDGQLSDPVALQ